MWWDLCAPGRARAGDRRERPDRVRGGEVCPILDVLVITWLGATKPRGLVAPHTITQILLCLGRTFYTLRHSLTHLSPVLLSSVSKERCSLGAHPAFTYGLGLLLGPDIEFDIRANVQSNAPTTLPAQHG